MMIAERDVDEIVLNILRECAEITPPLTGFELVTLFNERIILESEAMVSASLHRLASQRRIEAEGSSYRLREKSATP